MDPIRELLFELGTYVYRNGIRTAARRMWGRRSTASVPQNSPAQNQATAGFKMPVADSTIANIGNILVDGTIDVLRRSHSMALAR